MMRYIKSGNGKTASISRQIKLLVDQGNVPKAIGLIIKEIDRNPSDWYLTYLLGWVHQSQNNAEEALKAYKKAEDLSPENPQLKATIGELLLAVGQNEEALPYLKSSVLTWSESSEANSLYGIALLRTGKNKQAEELLKKSCRISNYNPDARAGLVELYTQTSQAHLIKPVLESYLNNAPDLASSYSLMADYMLIEEGNCESAYAYYEKAINLYSQSDNPKWFRQYISTKDYPDSKFESYLTALLQCEYFEITRDVIEEYLNPPQSNYWQAEILFQQGDIKGALQIVKQAVEGYPDDPSIRAKHAELLLVNGQLETAELEAKNVVNRCLELGWKEPWFDGLLIVALSEQGRHEEVKQIIHKIESENSERSTAAMIHYSSQLNRWEYVIRICQQLIQGDPNNSDAFYYLAKAYSDNSQFSESIEAYKQLLERQPENSRALFAIGFVYEGLGLLEEAKQRYQTALVSNNLSIPFQSKTREALKNLDNRM